MAAGVPRDPFEQSVQVDMWDGMTSVPGYSAIRFLDAWFYKEIGLAGATWDQALQYNARADYSLFSRRFSNWSYASSRVQLSPFAWIDADNRQAFTRARPPAYVAEQLAAFRRWGMDGRFGNFAFSSLEGSFDYAPYAAGLSAAAKPGTVDSELPQIAVTGSSSQKKGDKADIQGTASDDFAVRVVRWRDEQGHSGTAQLTPDDSAGIGGAVTWKVSGVPVGARSTRIWLLAEDIKGLATVAGTTVTR
jgi:hypothetical protein